MQTLYLKIEERKKRFRSPNFTREEKLALLHATFKYKDTLDCKLTDGVSVRAKEAAWEKVLDDYHARCQSSVKRNKDSLKACYDNIKKNARKKAAFLQTQMEKNGGRILENDPVFDLAMSMMNKKAIYKVVDKSDNDYQIEEQVGF